MTTDDCTQRAVYQTGGVGDSETVPMCESMLTTGVGLGDVPLIACSHTTFQCGLLEKQNGNKSGFSISSCGPHYYSLLSILGISVAILLS